MGNCFVTKLKESVNNDSLEYLNNLKIIVHSVSNPNANNFSIFVGTSSANTLNIIGDGHFTDGSFTEDRGKTAPTNANQKFANGNYTMLLPLTTITSIKAGSVDPWNVTDWQVDGLDYERLCLLNENTLTEIMFNTLDDLNRAIKHTKKVTIYSITAFSTTPVSLDPIFQQIITQEGRVDNFKFSAPYGSDFYGNGQLVRNVHLVSSSKYSVYNAADTTKLYDAEKVNGVWTYTLAE